MHGELVLCLTPHGTALDGTNFIKDLWNKKTEKLLFLTCMSRSGKCMHL
jgi:hypothetical protein